MAWSSDVRWGSGSAPPNDSLTCTGDLNRYSCYLDSASLGKFDAIAAIRMVISCLSILGATSIVVSAIAKRQVWSPKVLPIFVLSLADFLLALLWVIGGTLWLRRAPDREGCFAVSVLTIILECVTINLTLVYAALAYANIKKTDVGNILMNLDRAVSEQVWSRLKSFIVYFLAWALPVVIVMIQFGIVTGTTNIIRDADKCSCWCRPVFGNVLPYAVRRDIPTAVFIHNIRKLIASNGVVVGSHYLVVFILLVVIYYKILKHIKRMQMSIAGQTNDSSYGATQTLLSRGRSMARKRIMYFLTVFIISGFFNLLLSIATTIYECVKLYQEHTHDQNHAGHLIDNLSDSPGYQLYYWLYYMQIQLSVLMVEFKFQSVTIPIQGFLNAIVYGWTREDFLYVMAVTSKKKDQTEVDNYDEDGERATDDSGINSSTKEEHLFIRTLTLHTDVSDEEDNV